MLNNEHLVLAKVFKVYMQETEDNDLELLKYVEELESLPKVDFDLGLKYLNPQLDGVDKFRTRNLNRPQEYLHALGYIPQHVDYHYAKVYAFYSEKFKMVTSNLTLVNPCLIPLSNKDLNIRLNTMPMGRSVLEFKSMTNFNSSSFVQVLNLIFTGIMQDDDYCLDAYSKLYTSLDNLVQILAPTNLSEMISYTDKMEKILNEINMLYFRDSILKNLGLKYDCHLPARLVELYNFISEIETIKKSSIGSKFTDTSPKKEIENKEETEKPSLNDFLKELKNTSTNPLE